MDKEIRDTYRTFEFIELQLKYAGRVVCLVIVYRPPCVNNNLFFDVFSDYMSLLVTAPDYLLLSGDFYFHVNDTYDRTARCFLDILQSFNLTQNISCSTHIAGRTLDLVITRCGENFASSFEVSDPGISDHTAVKCKLNSLNWYLKRKGFHTVT